MGVVRRISVGDVRCRIWYQDHFIALLYYPRSVGARTAWAKSSGSAIRGANECNALQDSRELSCILNTGRTLILD